MRKKLFIPGPTEVIQESLDAMGTPMIGHRMKEYSDLQGRVTPKLKKFLHTDGPVFLGACSSTGWMEGAVRNCVVKKCVNFVNGAFSHRWHEVTKANGFQADAVTAEWGQPITPEMVDKALSTGQYDAITLVPNETSTGVMSPIKEIATVMSSKYPHVAFLVDAVSSMAGVDIDFTALGLDVLLAGVQKAFGLPAGLAVCAVSPKALALSAKATCKGLYFDFVDYAKYDKKDQTPATPSISHIFALDQKLDRFFAEGLEKRYKRHQDMADYVRAWARKHFEMFPAEGYASVTLSTIKNTRKMDIKKLNEFLATKGCVIANGYDSLKDKTFRIAHMADCTLAEIKQLIAWIDEFRAANGC